MGRQDSLGKGIFNEENVSLMNYFIFRGKYLRQNGDNGFLIAKLRKTFFIFLYYFNTRI